MFANALVLFITWNDTVALGLLLLLHCLIGTHLSVLLLVISRYYGVGARMGLSRLGMGERKGVQKERSKRERHMYMENRGEGGGVARI